MTTDPVSVAEAQRRSQIAAAAYERGRLAARAAANRRSLPDRAHARRGREEARSRPHSPEPRSDGRAFGVLDSDISVARAAAYLAATDVAHALSSARGYSDHVEQSWAEATRDRTRLHVLAWRERLTDNGIDDAVLRPGLSADALELPDELEGIDFEAIAEHTLDVSSTSADLPPVRLADLMLDTPHTDRSSESVVDITDQVAPVIELDRGVDTAVEGGVDAW